MPSPSEHKHQNKPILVRPPQSVRDAIQRTAEQERRSLNKQTLVLIEEALAARDAQEQAAAPR